MLLLDGCVQFLGPDAPLGPLVLGLVGNVQKTDVDLVEGTGDVHLKHLGDVLGPDPGQVLVLVTAVGEEQRRQRRHQEGDHQDATQQAVVERVLWDKGLGGHGSPATASDNSMWAGARGGSTSPPGIPTEGRPKAPFSRNRAAIQ